MTTPIYHQYPTLKEAQAKYDELKNDVPRLNLIAREDGTFSVLGGDAVLVGKDKLLNKNYN